MQNDTKRFVVSRRHEACTCREVFASDRREAMHECVGIHPDGETDWYIQPPGWKCDVCGLEVAMSERHADMHVTLNDSKGDAHVED